MELVRNHKSNYSTSGLNNIYRDRTNSEQQSIYLYDCLFYFHLYITAKRHTSAPSKASAIDLNRKIMI